MYKISVIIPVYNGEKYLEDCLKSIINQTLNDIEIICVNDGSTDGTLSILNRYSSIDNRIQVITTENKGQGSARNTGLNIAKGEYISFVDADDWIEKDALELLYNKSKSMNLDMLIYQMVNYIETSQTYVETDLYNHKCFLDHSLDEKTVFNHEDTKDYLFQIPVCPVSKLYKKDFFDKNNLHFPEGMFFEDNPFFYKSYFKAERVGFLKNQLYYRRRHSDSVTQSFDRRKFDIIKASNEVLDEFIKNNRYNDYKEHVINHSFSMLVEWFKKSPLDLRDEFYKLILKDFKGFNDLKDDFKEYLNDEFSVIFNLMHKNQYYLDFLTDYKIAVSDYEIYDNGVYYLLNSEKYFEYKNKQTGSLISVIIPVYNNEILIHRTLMSIENQSYGLEKIEVIMVNDASKDNTKKVLNDYADKYDNFKAIHIKKGTGSPGTPRNIGLLESNSEYLIFLDHDDYFEIDALEKLYETITNDDCDFVYGTYASVDNGLPTKIVYPNEHHGYFEHMYNNPRSIAFPPPSIWTKLFKKSLLMENNILFPTILGEDAVFVSKALFFAKGINYLWDDLICYHDLNYRSSTNNVNYDYLLEGFVSEEYMYGIYNDFQSENTDNDLDLYRIRAEGILDFYLNQFLMSDLNKSEIIKIFPILYSFVERIDNMGLKPHVNNDHIILFEYILEKDIASVIEFKEKVFELREGTNKDTGKKKLKAFIKKASQKTNTYPLLMKIKSRL